MPLTAAAPGFTGSSGAQRKEAPGKQSTLLFRWPSSLPPHDKEAGTPHPRQVGGTQALKSEIMYPWSQDQKGAGTCARSWRTSLTSGTTG